MIFRKKPKTLFLDPNSKPIKVDGPLNIILSPSLYWVKKITLFVKRVGEVKKLLPSIFEDTLPEGKYNYSVCKGNTNSEFLVFAYEDKKILDTLNKQNIAVSSIVNIHFAQSELSYLPEAIKINDNESIYVKDEIVVLVPNIWGGEEELNLNQVTLSKHKIVLQQFGHIVDEKNIYKIFAVLSIFVVLIFSELYITNQKANDILEQKNILFLKHSLKPTMLQNKTILKKYKTIHNKQMKIRDNLSSILTLSLKKDEKMIFLDIKNNNIFVNFSGIKNNDFTHIISPLKTKGIRFTPTYKDNILQLKVRL